MKKRTSLKEEPTLQTFSALTCMKFRPSSTKASEELMQKLQKKQEPTAKQLSKISFLGKRLSFVIELLQHHFLVGNQNQLDFISVGGRINQFVDTEYLWSINVKGPIQIVQLDPKKSIIVVYSLSSLFIFSFNNKKKSQAPKLILSQQIKDQVRFIRFPKEQCLVLFFEKHFQFYSFNEVYTQMKKTTSKKYGVKQNYLLLDVPPNTDNYLNAFFQEPKKNQSFGLWCLNITFDLIKIRVGTVFKIYDIMKKFKRVLQIKNYSKEVIFLNLGSEVIAAKKGFIIDSVNVNIKSQNSNLKYVGFQKLLHITSKRVQVYSFKVNLSTVPNRIVLKATDSLELGQIPSNSSFVAASINKQSNITVFFQNQETSHTNGQIEYWFKTSYSIDRQSKVKKVFNYGKEISTLDNQILQSKYDIAQKMGLSQKDIYLEIWNRSAKSSVEDYKFLLATGSYKTIRNQIENKLRKHTMSFRQLVKIQKSCFEMLHSQVFSKTQTCSQQIIQDFLTSHFYLKKLNLYKDIKLIQKKKFQIKFSEDNPQNDSILTIDIQEYSTYKEFQLKQFILDEVNDFCHRDKNDKIQQIRLIFKQFRFVTRMFYPQILRDMVRISKLGLLKLLNSMPQILPYHHILSNDDNPLLYSGVWSQIQGDEWTDNLYLDSITTVQNKELIEEFIDSIWFKRNYTIYHILVPKKKSEIQQINRKQNSQSIFYLFLSEVFLNYKQEIYDFNYISQIISYLENHFELLPQHLKSNIFLYYELFEYYMNQAQWKLPKMSLEQFFVLKDYELFRYFFDLEKIKKKNCILKEIKPIYKRLHIHGNQIFNEGLLSYFDNDVSELSDLKYILNRINSQKAQFHEENLSMYEILLKAMQMKIKFGAGQNSQATISQVLVYVQNIPTSLLMNQKNKSFHEQLRIIKNIQKHQSTLRKMNLNMTIQYMLKRCQDVILKMVDFQIQEKKLFKQKHYDAFKKLSIEILQNIQNIKDNIYGNVYPSLALFAFSTTVLENQQFIEYLIKLFNEEELKNLFQFDINFRQNLVIYAYKWKFSQQTVFYYNQGYLKKLFQILQSSNDTRKFLQNQLRLAIILSDRNQYLEYPISVNYVVPKAFELQQIVGFLSKQHISRIDFKQVCDILNSMHSISKNIKDSQKSFITLQKVYEIFMERLMKYPNSYIECFSIFKKYLSLKQQLSKEQNNSQCLDQFSAYISIFYTLIHTQINQESRQKMTELIGLLYKKPQRLLEILQSLLTQKRTGLQMTSYLSTVLSQVNSLNLLCFNPKNTLLQSKLLAQANSQNNKVSYQILNKVVKNTLENAKIQRQVFKVNQIYNVIFITLCQSPLNCLTILRFYKQKIKYKQLRNYISYLTQEVIFNENQLLQCFVILFDVLLKNFKYNLEFEDIISQNYIKSQKQSVNTYQIFKQMHQIQIFQNPQEDYYKKLLKSLKRFLRKRNSLNLLHKSRRKTVNKPEQIDFLIQHQSQIDTSRRSRAKRQQKHYPFSDSDFAVDDEMNPNPPKILRRRRKFLKIDFDCSNQRLKMLKRTDQDLTQYLASTFEATFVLPNNSNNEDQFSQKESTLDQGGNHKFKISERKKSVEQQKLKQVHEQQKNKYRVNRMLGVDSVPTQYISSHIVNHMQPISPRVNKKGFNFFDPQNSQSFNENGTDFVSFQQSPKLRHDKTQLKISMRQQPSIQEVKSILIKSSSGSNDSSSVKIFDLKILTKIKDQHFKQSDDKDDKFNVYIRQLMQRIYSSNDTGDTQKLNLINQIVKKFSTYTRFCNKRVLEIYIRFSSLKKSYDINIDANQIFTFQCLLEEHFDSSLLFSFSQERILGLMNDSNAIKIARLIALALRKNSLEQELIYKYFLIKIKQLNINSKSILDQKEELVLRKLIFAMPTKRFNDNFIEILSLMRQIQTSHPNQRQLHQKITNFILQSIKAKGDYRSYDQLQKQANQSKNSQTKQLLVVEVSDNGY